MQSTKAQFANTSWIGTFRIPEETQLLVQFKSDSLIVSYLNSGETLERMKYRINKDTLTIVKLDGESPCSYTNEATYTILMRDEKLYIKALSDDCPERATAWPEDGFVRKD